MCEFVLIVSLIFSYFESTCYSRFGSQELAKGRESGTKAAGDEKVSK